MINRIKVLKVPAFTFSHEVDMSSHRRSIVLQCTSSSYVANDDEVERFRRRNNSELQKKVSNSDVANGSNLSSDDEVVDLSDSKLQDHYQTCVKLFTENKINAKNAWNVHIVEYMQAMLKKGLVMKDTLKLASTSIDIGCKVYCLKVDQVHSDLFKLANAMARIDLNDKKNDAETAPTTDEEVEFNRREIEKKKEIRRSYGQDREITIATNETILNGNITPHKTAFQQVNSGKSRLYTLSAFTKQRWGFELMVNCRSNFSYHTSLRSATENVKISNQKISVNIPVPKSSICPSFMDFVIDRWQPDDDDAPIGSQPLSNLSQNSTVYDDNGLPIPELDASDYEIGSRDGEFEDAQEIMETAIGHTGIRPPVAFITEMRPGQGPLSEAPLQYSYRSAPVVSDRYMLSGVWAGPSHWKIKSLCRTINNAGESVNVALQRGKRSRRSEAEIVRLDVEYDVKEALVSHKKNKKKKKHIRRGSISKVTLPEDMNVTVDNLCRLKFRPDVLIKLESPAELNSNDTSRVNLNMTANYQYDNPDDADYCSQTIVDNGDGDGDDQNYPSNDNDVQQPLTCENMVNMPSQSQKFQVPYAMQAKRIDMRKLKDAVWKSMAISQTGNNNNLEDNEKLKKVKLKNVQFSKMLEILPHQMTNKMAENLSAPLAFVALLHLANEENLSLEGTPELNDVFISTGDT